MASAPAYAANPRSIDIGQVSTANTNRDGTGTIVTIATGSTAGLRINSVTVKATATTTAGMVRLYLSTDSGTTWRLFDEIGVRAITASASVDTFRHRQTYDGLILTGSTNRLGASTHNAETFNVVALGADL